MMLSRNRSWPRAIAVALIVAFAVTYAGPVAAQGVTGQKKVLVLFPPDNPANVKPALLQALTDGLKAQVHAAGIYQVVEYSPRASSIARALAEQRLTDQDVRGPFDLQRGVVLGKEMGCDLFMVSSVEEYKFDKEKTAVSLIILGQIGDPKTGKLICTATVTGTAADALGLREEDQLATLAAIDAVNQLDKGLFPERPVIEKAPKKNKNLVWVLLGVAALVVAANANQGGGGQDNEGPPAPP
jgi:hypothetical protein